MNIVSDSNALQLQPRPLSSLPSILPPLPQGTTFKLAGPGLAGSGLAGFGSEGTGIAGAGVAGATNSAGISSGQIAPSVDPQRPLADRVVDLVKELVQTAISQLFEMLQSGIVRLVDSLLSGKTVAGGTTVPALASTPTTSTSPNSTSSLTAESVSTANSPTGNVPTGDSPSTASRVGDIVDGLASAANFFVLGRGIFGIAGKIKGGAARGAKSVATYFENSPGVGELLRNMSTRLRSTLP